MSSIGTANPTPSAPASVTPMAVVMPMSRPCASTRAPPLEPLVMGASVWSMPNSRSLGPLPTVTSRSKADTTPTVTDAPPGRPSGLPMATAWSPIAS